MKVFSMNMCVEMSIDIEALEGGQGEWQEVGEVTSNMINVHSRTHSTKPLFF